MVETKQLAQKDGPLSVTPLGIIGGYGISDSIDIKYKIQVETNFGKPTHPIIVGELGGRNVAFLSRHGKGRSIPSHEINYRANLIALRKVGVKRILSATANGSLRHEIEPGDIVVPTDYIDETKTRPDTYYNQSPAVHFSSYRPFCSDIGDIVEESAKKEDFKTHYGTVVIIEGPRFATLSESKMYKELGADIIGGSTYPEMALARELEMCYANFALITDYDNVDMIEGVTDDPVTVDIIDNVLSKYADKCTKIIERSISNLGKSPCQKCIGHRSTSSNSDVPSPLEMNYE